MATITANIVKELRQKTNAGMMDCKNALSKANGDIKKAEKILREEGIASASKKSSRATGEGTIASYIHNNKVGVLIEINCETDFVARNEKFQSFVNDLCLHIAASAPRFLTKNEITAKELDSERAIFRKQMENEKKPANVIEKIIEGKINKFCSEICLMDQSFVKDSNITIDKLVKTKISELGENIVIKRFTRYVLGE